MFGTHFQAAMAGVFIAPVTTIIFGEYWLIPLVAASFALGHWVYLLDKQTGQV